MSQNSSFEPDNVNQLDEWIEEGKNLGMSHDNLCLKVRDGDLITPYQTLVCRYYYALVPFTHTITLTDEEYVKYKNNPKGLSQKLYETPELWSSLMYINNVVSISEFKKKQLVVFRRDIISKLEELMVLAAEDIEKNRIEIQD